jgi:Predicted nucleotide-binding protein containing TIR-like domain
MAAQKLRVLVLYGGDAATAPRHELVSWMVEKRALNVEPVLVAWGTAHSDGSVAERVKQEIDLADKAIAIVTKDARSTHGAPNVIEEIGRWLQAKGGRTLCVIRQEGTQINSNASGLIYLSFESRIREVFDDLRDFLTDDAGAKDSSPPSGSTAPTVASSSEFTLTSNPNWILLGQRAYQKVSVEETPETVTAIVACAESADEAAIRGLSRRAEISITYKDHVAQGVVSESRILHEAQSIGAVVVSIQDRYQQRGLWGDVSFGGPNRMSADEIAEQRTRQESR